MLFCDLDGVLADFDRHHLAMTGAESSKLLDTTDWGAVARTPMFYATMPVMSDAFRLWCFIQRYNPIILTGLPSSIPGAGEQKKAWVATHLDPRATVVTCKSREKSLYCCPGDVLIDDWEKYRSLWEAKAGRWITHVSAEKTVAHLKAMGF